MMTKKLSKCKQWICLNYLSLNLNQMDIYIVLFKYIKYFKSFSLSSIELELYRKLPIFNSNAIPHQVNGH